MTEYFAFEMNLSRFKIFVFCLVSTAILFVICTSRKDLIQVKKMFNSVEDATHFQDVGSSTLQPEPSGRLTHHVTPTLVLIITYMRSGSSLTGDILQQANGAFYVYEPFHMLQYAMEANNSTILDLTNGSKRFPPYDFAEEAVKELYDWLTCDVMSLPTKALKDGFMNIGLKSRIYPLCLTEKIKTLNESDAIKMCAKQLQTVCTESSFRIVKTIRLEMSSVTHLLGMFPNLKIVHLVRDPRATLVSQAYVGMCSKKHGGMLQCANNLCKRVENDILEKERIMSELPGRIFPVVYEDIAREPIETAKKLFDFIGADFTEEAKEYIFNITKAGHEDNCVICTTRSNSTKHIDAWKTEMKTTLLNVVQERCNYVLRRYNYTILPYES